jgi:Spy/CpxP family protein refolding chaperone
MITCFGIASAQPPQAKQHPNKQNGVQNMKHKRAKMAHHIQLNPAQKTQAKAISQAYQEKYKQLKSNDKITMGEYKKQLAAIQKERKTKMDAILTTQQKDKIVQFKKQAEENAQVKNAARVERMKIRLDLKDEQVAKLKNIHSQMAQKMKTIRENDNLTMEDKKDKMKELAKERQEAVKALLTPEQVEKMQSFKPKKGQVK